jgi:hypothetical protein
MNRNEEDEIQVLGEIHKKTRKSTRKWIYLVIGGIVLSTLLLVCLLKDKAEAPEILFATPAETDTTSSKPDENIFVSKDSINDVVFTLYELENLYAGLQIGLPDINDTTLLFVLQAADVRKDNEEILGDYVIDGIQLFRGKSKAGYCAIVDGKISLGMSLKNDVKDYCITHKGSFFRQFALVIDNEIQANKLKGKALRSAIAGQGNKLYIIKSCNPESLYDFSEALADMGMTHAIYLIGSTSYGWYRLNGTVHEFGKKIDTPFKNANYLLFRKQNPR